MWLLQRASVIQNHKYVLCDYLLGKVNLTCGVFFFKLIRNTYAELKAIKRK
jgi:hypothetical protein